MSRTYIPYIFSEIFCIAYAVTILLHMGRGVGLDRETRELKKLIVTYLVEVLTDLPWALVENGTYRLPHLLYAFICGISVTATAIGCYYWCRFVEIRLEQGRVHSRKVQLALNLPIAAMSLLDMVSTFTGWVFYIDPQGHYQTGKLFWAQGLVTFAYLLAPTAHALYKGIRTPLREKRKEYLTYGAYLIVPVAGVAVETHWPTVPLMELSVFLMIQILFLTLYLDQAYKLAKKEKELTESRMAIMMSQIQPHFLYNTLAVIQEMCHDKAPEAEAATIEFAEFLRGNMNSLGSDHLIPFEKELSHTKNYLSLEKRRFGDRLTVEYEIREDAFLIPALTLQPIVENAVHHGLMGRPEGGLVRITAVRGGRGCVVTVEDNGVGFDPARPQTDGRSHIGISNVRERLQTMCGGTLDVHSTVGQGTVTVITIPSAGGAA